MTKKLSIFLSEYGKRLIVSAGIILLVLLMMRPAYSLWENSIDGIEADGVIHVEISDGMKITEASVTYTSVSFVVPETEAAAASEPDVVLKEDADAADEGAEEVAEDAAEAIAEETAEPASVPVYNTEVLAATISGGSVAFPSVSIAANETAVYSVTVKNDGANDMILDSALAANGSCKVSASGGQNAVSLKPGESVKLSWTVVTDSESDVDVSPKLSLSYETNEVEPAPSAEVIREK